MAAVSSCTPTGPEPSALDTSTVQVDSESSATAPHTTGSASSTEPVGTSADPTDSTPTEDSMPDDETDQTIRFDVEGGYLALMRSIVIEPDGRATIEVSGRTSTAEFDADTVGRLRQQLDDTGLFGADSRLEIEGADLQQYTITYRGATLVATDGVVPIELTATFAELEQLILDNR